MSFDLPLGEHCDEWIDDESKPECVRKFVDYHRLPAICQAAGRDPEEAKSHVSNDLKPYVWTNPRPNLFARYEGNIVRVTMASRFGDVGITQNLTQEFGYYKRVMLSELTDFREKL